MERRLEQLKGPWEVRGQLRKAMGTGRHSAALEKLFGILWAAPRPLSHRSWAAPRPLSGVRCLLRCNKALLTSRQLRQASDTDGNTNG